MVAVVQRRLLTNVTRKHDLDISWRRKCSGRNWWQMNDDDTTEKD